jgi:AraC-like DNA-binding protein
MDVLQAHLARARASGGVFARTVARPPWGLRLPGSVQLAVHTVVQGRAWLWRGDARDPVGLAPGDVSVVRGGSDHFVAYEPGAECLLPEDFRARHAEDTYTSDPGSTVFLCGAYRFSGDVGQGLIEALPPVLTLSAALDDPIYGVIALISRELSAPGPGQQTVLDRLLDVLLVLTLRVGYAESETAPRWYRASNELRLGPALRAIHTKAEQPWTVTELARLSGMSRASFARVFQHGLGQAPMQYLTDWRMTIARDLLLTSDATLADIAERTGYASAYAFATAFRRHHDTPPGQWRLRHVQMARSPSDAHEAVTAR